MSVSFSSISYQDQIYPGIPVRVILCIIRQWSRLASPRLVSLSFIKTEGSVVAISPSPSTYYFCEPIYFSAGKSPGRGPRFYLITSGYPDGATLMPAHTGNPWPMTSQSNSIFTPGSQFQYNESRGLRLLQRPFYLRSDVEMLRYKSSLPIVLSTPVLCALSTSTAFDFLSPTSQRPSHHHALAAV